MKHAGKHAWPNDGVELSHRGIIRELEDDIHAYILQRQQRFQCVSMEKVKDFVEMTLTV